MSGKQNRTWIYARGTEFVETSSLVEELLEDAETRGLSVVGVSQDTAAGPWMSQPGIKEVQRAVRRGFVNIVLVESLEQISAENQMRRRFLKMLQDYGVILMSSGTDLRYELWLSNLEEALLKRAARKCCGMPW